jgi:DNA gyrase subunit A
MAEIAREIVAVNLEDEMRQSYLDYAMSVIVGRALPDVRDGLKPVHRRVLFAMRELGNDYNKAYKKSARVVGDVIGKYHPHGDTAVYDTIVRMAQPFALRYMLVDGQGNFGSVDGDAPAAMRYTEVRMAKIAHELLSDIEKETVDFAENYDGSESEPTVLPTRIPNLLINGSAGIAVGMATNIPPHNLTEVVNACIALIDNPDLSAEDLIGIIPGPDFPTAAFINGASGIYDAYRTGRGKIYMRARSHVELLNEASGKQAIVITELPYQVNKARLLERIAELVRDRKIEGITELRDESDKDGMRVVIELRRGEVPEVVLNNLYQHTPLQSVFGINMVALVDGRPRLLNLREMLDAFLRHRREVVTRRTIFDLRKARERAHVLEGQAVALANIDPVIQLIKTSPSPAEAKAALTARAWEPGVVTDLLARSGAESTRPENIDAEYGLLDDGYHLSPVQAQAILDLRLQRLTGLEQDKIVNEYKELLENIKGFIQILEDPAVLLQVIRDELIAVLDEYGDERRTEIMIDHKGLSLEDLISEEDVVVTLSREGYAKSQPVTDYQAQRRGGRGRSATKVKEADFVDQLWVVNTHDTLLCFSSRGKLYWMKVYELPQAGRGSRGKPIVNLLALEQGERINTVLPIREYEDDKYILMATSAGTVKKTALSAYSRPRSNGIIAIDLRGDDYLVGATITDGNREIMLCTSEGKSIRFRESDVRPMGRTAAGVRGIRVGKGHEVIALLTLEGGSILTATENGFGKRSKPEEFPVQGRGGQGVIAVRTSERNGRMVGALQVDDEHEVMLITSNGTLVRTAASEISEMGRSAQGVRLIRLDSGDHLVGMQRIEMLEGEESAEEAAESDGNSLST